MKIKYRKCDCCGKTLLSGNMFVKVPIRIITRGYTYRVPGVCNHTDICMDCMLEIEQMINERREEMNRKHEEKRTD